MKKRSQAINTLWTVILTILSLAWVYPVVVVLINSFKKDSAISTNTAFQLPPADGFAGLGNYANAIHSKGFLAAFFNSFIISVTSVVLILVCCSMCAWFITRVKTWATKLCYFLFVFSMVVPFQMLMFTLYAITMLSLYGGKLPTIFINRTGGNAYNCRMKAMFIFALFPLLGLVAQTLGAISCWLTICIIGIVGAAHQSWSANLFSVGSDLFPKKAVATITGINGMAGGLSSFLINFVSGRLLDHVEAAQTVFCGFQGKEAGYFLIFCYCSVAYIAGWLVMKLLVPRYMPVKA